MEQLFDMNILTEGTDVDTMLYVENDNSLNRLFSAYDSVMIEAFTEGVDVDDIFEEKSKEKVEPSPAVAAKSESIITKIFKGIAAIWKSIVDTIMKVFGKSVDDDADVEIDEDDEKRTGKLAAVKQQVNKMVEAIKAHKIVAIASIITAITTLILIFSHKKNGSKTKVVKGSVFKKMLSKVRKSSEEINSTLDNATGGDTPNAETKKGLGVLKKLSDTIKGWVKALIGRAVAAKAKSAAKKAEKKAAKAAEVKTESADEDFDIDNFFDSVLNESAEEDSDIDDITSDFDRLFAEYAE